MARDIGVPGLVVPRQCLPVHQLADAASQGTHAKRPRFPLSRDTVDGLAFSLWCLLVVERVKCSWGQVAVFSIHVITFYL